MSLRAERMSLRIKLAGLRVDRARLLSDQRLAGGEIGGDREGIVVAHVAQHSEHGAKRKSNPGKIPKGSFRASASALRSAAVTLAPHSAQRHAAQEHRQLRGVDLRLRFVA